MKTMNQNTNNKIAIITDLHLGYKEDTSQSKLMYQYLNEFFDNIKRLNIKNVFILGDIFDNREVINFLTISNTYKHFINHIMDNDLTVYIIAGNHDCYYKNTNNLYSVELLFSHIKNLHLIKNYGENIIINNTSILMIPWLNSENYEHNMNLISNSNSDYLMGHFEITGFTMVRGIKCSNGLNKNIFNKFKKVFSGHFHLKQQLNNIYYVGTPYEKDWNDVNSEKGYIILDLDNNNIESVRNENYFFKILNYDNDLDLKDIENIQDKEVKLIINSIDKQKKFDDILQKLYECNPSKLQIIDNTSNINHTDEKEIDVNKMNDVIKNNDNISYFNEYIKNLKIDDNIDKKMISEILINLYNESISKC